MSHGAWKKYFSDALKLKETDVIHEERCSAIAELSEKRILQWILRLRA